eukprot:scaffold28702_cov62-Phaeocystis_antarctica.AAC.6
MGRLRRCLKREQPSGHGERATHGDVTGRHLRRAAKGPRAPAKALGLADLRNLPMAKQPFHSLQLPSVGRKDECTAPSVQGKCARRGINSQQLVSRLWGDISRRGWRRVVLALSGLDSGGGDGDGEGEGDGDAARNEHVSV